MWDMMAVREDPTRVCVCKIGPGPLNNIHAEFVGYMYTVTVALLVVSRRRDINSSGSTLRAVAG